MKKNKQCKHDFKVLHTFKSKKELRPLSVFSKTAWVDTIIRVSQCKKCNYHQVL